MDFSQEAHSRAVLDAVSDAIFVLDEKLTITDVNSEAKKILGASSGKNLKDICEGFFTMTWTKLDESVWPPIEAVRTKTRMDFRGYMLKPGKKFFPISATAVPFDAGSVFVVRDITKEIAQEKELRDFVGIASHQLRTPLASILWFLELVLSGTVGEIPKRQWELLLQAYNAATRLADMVRLLLDVSRIDLVAIAIKPSPQDLASLVREEVARINIFADRKHQTIKVTVPEGVPQLMIDPSVFGFVLQNLLSNAIKYTPEGGTIAISIVSGNSEYEIRVSDTGYGVPKSEQSRIFQKFFRSENVIFRVPEGTGLGLYIARSLSELWGGRMWFRSEENKGTTFSFAIPKGGFREIAGRIGVERPQAPLY